MDYNRNRKYFQSANFTPSIILGVIGLLALSAGNGAIIVGLLFLAGAGFLAYRQTGGRPTDGELDKAVMSQLSNLQERALKKLGVDEDQVKEIAPITFDGYRYDNAQIKKGSDGKYRSDKYEAVMFFFSEHEVHCYTYNFSLTENSQRESTDVYFYKNIVSVSTQTQGTSYSVGKGKSSQFDYEYFKLTTTGGTSISCNVRNADDAQRSIHGMRQLIMEKNRGMA